VKAKVQVVLCKCCTEMPTLLDMERLAKVAAESDNVLSVLTVEAVCDGKQLAELVNDVKDKELDRAVVLACHKKDVSPAVLKAYRRAGVNEFMVELVNIREEVVLPHQDEPERAQAKAESKLRAALARARLLAPLEKQSEIMRTRNIVVIGAGVSGQAAAREAVKSGAHAILLEKTGKSLKAPGVILPNSTLVGAEGYGGNFKLKIRAGEKIEVLEAAAVVLATGGGWTQLKGPLAKAVKDAMPLYKLYEQLQAGAVPRGPVVIVDTPDPAGKTLKVQDYAWDDTLETAVELKKRHPDIQIWIVFQEMRAFGLSELAYKEAAEMGIKFIRYDKAGAPKIDPKNPTSIAVKDFSQGELVNIDFGSLVFASIPSNPDNEGIAEALRIPMTAEGGVRRGSIQRWPVTTPKPGVFVCGSALFPKSREIATSEGEAAGAMAGEFVKKGTIEFGGAVAEVEQEKCSACLTCVRTCPYEAPFIGKAGKAEIRIQGCQGCGMCVGICPSKAIELHHYTDEQVMTETRTLLGGDF
jgi:heterodisulfide reductase subunit A-like polyferredoxin